MDRWSLEYEVDDSGTTPGVLDALTDITFDDHTINIKDCENDVEYEYTLDGQYIWDLRYILHQL